ncbi:hypothetical protein EIP91_006924 [Steccherinum ochraceum]|uniref:Uncharacterized protein n=1 Tax=Steccherinum ochraceum TaxID=92696 RepID=A0A4R0R4Z4_9APHY|nr:hypothetical protein EIP91_006924 [Steccherinum ochraceum]
MLDETQLLNFFKTVVIVGTGIHEPKLICLTSILSDGEYRDDLRMLRQDLQVLDPSSENNTGGMTSEQTDEIENIGIGSEPTVSRLSAIYLLPLTLEAPSPDKCSLQVVPRCLNGYLKLCLRTFPACWSTLTV